MQGLEPFPSRDVWKRFLDYLMYGVGILAPIALVPQIMQIYTTRSADGISLLTWLSRDYQHLVGTLWRGSQRYADLFRERIYHPF